VPDTIPDNAKRAAAASRPLLALCLGSCLLLPSCFTTLLWGGDPFMDDSNNIHAWRGSYSEATMRRYGPEHSGNGLPLWQRIVLTPLAVELDLLTLPLQGRVLGNDDDDTGDTVYR
jgi:hypothetical protein